MFVFFFFMNKNLLDFFNFVSIIIITKNKNCICLIQINNEIFTNIFIVYNINKIKKGFFIDIFHII